MSSKPITIEAKDSRLNRRLYLRYERLNNPIFTGEGFGMGLGITNSELDESKQQALGLIFDAEGVTLAGQYGDEFTAYRSRREWQKVLKTFFLLEAERDYHMSVLCCEENGMHVLSCYFTSACGRYAFWRLINEQAPEAEKRLFATNPIATSRSNNFIKSIWNSKKEDTPWVISSDTLDNDEENPGVFVRFFNDVSRFFR